MAHVNLFRSSRPEVFCRGVLREFAKFTRKHLCQSLFFNKVAWLRPATLSKRRLWHKCLFSSEFCQISKNTVFIEHLWWLLLFVFWTGWSEIVNPQSSDKDWYLTSWKKYTDTEQSHVISNHCKSLQRFQGMSSF